MARKKQPRVIAKKTASKSTAPKTAKQKRSASGSASNKSARVERSNPAGKRNANALPLAAGHAGELVIKGKFTDDEKQEIISMMRKTGKTGPRDQSDVVIAIEDTSRGMRILTSGNKLAVSVGKRVHRAHKGGKLTITWSSDNMPVHVTYVR